MKDMLQVHKSKTLLLNWAVALPSVIGLLVNNIQTYSTIVKGMITPELFFITLTVLGIANIILRSYFTNKAISEKSNLSE